MLTPGVRCWLCQLPLKIAAHGICSICCRTLLRPAALCPRCGLPAALPSIPCGRCQQKPPPWRQMIAVTDYRPPLSTLVQRLKYQGMWQLAPALARLMLLRYLQARRERGLSAAHRVVAVPLHHRRQWRRGFNQTQLLARPLARWLSCRTTAGLLRRVKNTPAQQTLTAGARRRNLRNAFVCTERLDGETILLLDDVITTGSTVAEISRLLLDAGAASVQVICLCRTL